MKTFARSNNEIKCMDLAYIDKLAKYTNGLKYLLVRRDLFVRTIDAKQMKTRDSRESVRAFLTPMTKTNQLKEFWVDKGAQFAGDLRKICKAEGIQ